LLALVLYAVTLGGTYVYDDLFFARDDERLHDVGRWGEFWTTDYFAGGIDKLYRPLTSMTYALQWQLHGDRPRALHLVNWLMHAGASALVAELARRLSGTRVAYAAGLLFAAHPVHVEAVANVVGRAELMCALGTFGALVLMARRPLTVRRALGIFGCFLLALLSKEQGMLLPLLLLLLGVVVYRRPTAPDEDLGAPPVFSPAERRAVLLLAMALCWALAGYIVFRESYIHFWWDRQKLDWTVNPMVRSAGADRWLMPLALLGRYTALLVAPVRLSVDYGTHVIGPVAHANDPYLWLGAAALLLWVALFVGAVRNRARSTVFCLLALGILYGLVGNVLTLIGTIFGERLMYLPSAFFLVLVGQMLARAPRKAGAAALAALLLLGSLRTVTYAARWNDRLAFYEAAAAEQPRSLQVHILLANELRERHMFARAEAVAAAARDLAPDHWEPYLYSAMIALDAGDLDRARSFALKCRSIQMSGQVQGLLADIQERRAATQAPTQPSQ
jgi:hypothetical protein